MVRKVLIGALMIVAVFAAPAAAQYPDFTITPGGVETGGVAGFSGSGCPPGSTVTIAANGQTLATVVANAQGEYSGTATINLPPGNYTASATCGDIVRTFPLNVRGVSQGRPPAGVGGGTGGAPLPRTGSDSNNLAVVGAALLLVGGGAMVVARKRFA